MKSFITSHDQVHNNHFKVNPDSPSIPRAHHKSKTPLSSNFKLKIEIHLLLNLRINMWGKIKNNTRKNKSDLFLPFENYREYTSIKKTRMAQIHTNPIHYGIDWTRHEYESLDYIGLKSVNRQNN
ncbi:hypothetical protein [Flavivirga sp. 57AJ16]|uniref:hypothetical protein n=1 Tax=Flavivirga sp. 57AJ16 TaxID=3025307 RepID=UPI00236509A4|nr:hypothetical protein [Flavivirga sp. 57AJ16]MDD7884515.1 hypothetical protein [Flavivirga sp. 57AJ16]